MISIKKRGVNEIIKHCKEEYPKEACGILVGKKEKVTKVYCMKNISDNPEMCYMMEPGEQLKVFKEMRQLGINMLGIYHSHAKTAAYPSKRDCELAYYPEAYHVIVSLKDFEDPDIRSFEIVDGTISEEEVIMDLG